MGAADRAGEAALADRGVTHVLTLGHGMDMLSAECGLVRATVPVADEATAAAAAQLEAGLPEALDFIDAGLAGGGAVLVHCFAGVSRSVTVVAAWLMLRSGRADCADAEGALAAVRAARPRAKPNAAFWAMLERLEHTRVDNG
eukprot:PRCOL_00006891-RA